jgi:hypothetical protein
VTQPFSRLAGALISAFFAVACGAAGPQVVPPAEERQTVERLYPLRMGSVWTYDVETGQGLPTLAIARVTRAEGAVSEVSSGADPIVYEHKPQGLFRPDRGIFVLKAPIRKGSHWEASQGGTAEIVDTDKQMTTPAGEFRGCVEVLETGGSTGKRVRTVFCPDVGPVEVESSMQMEMSGQTARVVARLRGYDFSGALQ